VGDGGSTKAFTYQTYLGLDELLASQRPVSEEHDEMLFIVIHQVYELWFKQLLHEAAHVQRNLEAGDGPRVMGSLKRMLTILKTVVAQVDVLETMTPRQFTSFRSRLQAASGFQSAQFRQLEAVMGARDRRVLASYEDGSPAAMAIAAAMDRRSLYDSFLLYLGSQGYQLPQARLERDVTAAAEPSREVQDVLLAVYRDDGEAAQVAERMIDLDEGIQEWRYRHVKMVERTIGHRIGTGGSAGAEYLRRTLFNPAFPDLWEVRSEL
jgi:tryptophan 2,3-dioxygenase